jgi:esterase/lipase superfamily enzyme
MLNSEFTFVKKITMSAPLTNLQLELLKVFAIGASEEELLDIRRILARYFMQKAVRKATQVWHEKGYTAEKLLQPHS